MSISASWVIVAVLLIRLLLKKAPKWINCVLWGIVGLRLVIPLSFESVFSLIPSNETISRDISYKSTSVINSGVSAFDNAVNPIIEKSFAEQPTHSVNPLQILLFILSVAWLIGIAVILVYTVASYLHLRKKMLTSVLLENNIFQSENVVSPFVLGIIKPKIYLPFNIEKSNIDYVVAHEQAHIKRKDYIIKPIGFVILAIHWFNPLVWLAYALFCRDIEFACDEKVVKNFDREQKADYSNALLLCSVNRRIISACPIAFGEVGVKHRIKTVLNYKKPAFWIIIVSIVLIAAVSVCFLTNPISKNNAFVENSLLYDLGAESYADIQKVEFNFEENALYTGNNIEITEQKDIKILSDYTYTYDWPSDKLNEIFVYPNNSIYITVNGNNYQLFLHDDRSLTVVAPLQESTFRRTYKASDGKGITDAVWLKFIKNYCSDDKTNSDYVTEQKIETRLQYNKITNAVNKQYLQDVFADDFEEQYEQTKLPETDEAVKTSLAEDTAICSACEKNGILVSGDEAEKRAKAELNALQTNDTQSNYYAALKNILSENQISEDEYLKLLIDEAYYKYNRSALQAYFYDNIFDKSAANDFEQQFEEYIKNL